jgi:pilin isopeptide linkage protein
MFEDCTSLSRLTLGDSFVFINELSTIPGDPKLPNPPAETTLGHWILEDDVTGATAVTSEELYQLDSVAGTWIWQEEAASYTINFSSGDIGTGSMAQVRPAAAADYQIPSAGFIHPNKKVVAWNDGMGHVFQANSVIPADTYAIGDEITLTAVWEDINSITQISEGVYELEMLGNNRTLIPNLPAGASYRVYEQNEDGWTLIEQSNTTGIIQSLQTATASFTNQYSPNVTSVMLYGTKTLDNRAADANSFNFELWEGDELKDTQPVQAGGAIMFGPIVYDEAGMHTYTIKEVLGNDSTITYDEHPEIVSVLVQSVDGHLTATVEYDSDGVKFANKHNPGNLKLTKNVVGQTEANKDDEFTFKVRLRNPNGEPFDNGIYLKYENHCHLHPAL